MCSSDLWVRTLIVLCSIRLIQIKRRFDGPGELTARWNWRVIPREEEPVADEPLIVARVRLIVAQHRHDAGLAALQRVAAVLARDGTRGGGPLGPWLPPWWKIFRKHPGKFVDLVPDLGKFRYMAPSKLFYVQLAPLILYSWFRPWSSLVVPS